MIRDFTTELDRNPIKDLSDVNVGTPNDGDTLVYDAATGKWVSGPPGVGGAMGEFRVTLFAVAIPVAIE